MILAFLLVLSSLLSSLCLGSQFTSGLVSQRDLQTSSLVLMYNKDLSQCYLFEPQSNSLLFIALRVAEDQYKLTAVGVRSTETAPDPASALPVNIVSSSTSTPESLPAPTAAEKPVEFVDVGSTSAAAPEASATAGQAVEYVDVGSTSAAAPEASATAGQAVEFVDVGSTSAASPEASATAGQAVEFVDVGSTSAAAPEASTSDATPETATSGQGSTFTSLWNKVVEFFDISGYSKSDPKTSAGSSRDEKPVEFIDVGETSTETKSSAVPVDSSARRSLSVTRMTSGELQMLDMAATKFSKGKAQVEESFDSKSGTKLAKKNGNPVTKKFSDSLVLTDPSTSSSLRDKLRTKPQKNKQTQSVFIDPVSSTKSAGKKHLRNRD